MGTRLCPPARIFASSPYSASSPTASATVSGRWYAKLAAFMPAPSRQQPGQGGLKILGQQRAGAGGTAVPAPADEEADDASRRGRGHYRPEPLGHRQGDHLEQGDGVARIGRRCGG